MKILKEIQNKLDKETRNPEELIREMQQLGFQMLLTNVINKEQVIVFCTDMIKLYELLLQKQGME